MTCIYLLRIILQLLPHGPYPLDLLDGSKITSGDFIPSSRRLVFYLWLVQDYHVLDCYAHWTAGVDSEQLRWGRDEEITEIAPPAPVEQTIEEDRAAEAENDPQDIPIATPRRMKRNSYQRLSNLSDEARLSITSLSFSPDKNGGTDSNRSSTTIKGIQVNGTNATGAGLNDLDFEHALKKFATQRESFLLDLTLSAGAVVPNRPKPRPKTQKIVNEDGGGLKSGVGSIRRRISFRDMNSMKRQSSVKRQCEQLYRYIESATSAPHRLQGAFP